MTIFGPDERLPSSVTLLVAKFKSIDNISKHLLSKCHCREGGTVKVTRLDPLPDLERPCFFSSNTLALILGVLSGRKELMVV